MNRLASLLAVFSRRQRAMFDVIEIAGIVAGSIVIIGAVVALIMVHISAPPEYSLDDIRAWGCSITAPDNTACFQRALNYAYEHHGEVHVIGDYRMGQP